MSARRTKWVLFFQAEDGIRDPLVTGVQRCALPIWFGAASDKVVGRARLAPGAGPGDDPVWGQHQIGRASLGKECRSWWSPEHEKKKAKTCAHFAAMRGELSREEAETRPVHCRDGF